MFSMMLGTTKIACRNQFLLITVTITLGSLFLCSWSEAQKTTTYRNPGSAMEPTIMADVNILIQEFGPQNKTIKRGDIVVFPYPEDTSKLFVKRVIGIGGDKLEIKDKKVFINDKLLEEPYVDYKEPSVMPAGTSNRDNMSAIRIPEDSVFVMGDNRDRSFDSRFWGYVKVKDLIGLLVNSPAQKK